jgi:hypothetical protein
LPSPLPEVIKSIAGPPGTADAVLASDNDKLAAPSTGKALLRRFRFEACSAFDMIMSSHPGRPQARCCNPTDRSGFLTAEALDTSVTEDETERFHDQDQARAGRRIEGG